MSMEPLALLILAAYGSLLLELLVFPIPSEASTYQIFSEPSQGESQGDSQALDHARNRSALGKLLFYFLPTALGVVLFLVPLVAVFWPKIIGYLVPLRPLETAAVTLAGAFLIVGGRLLTFTSVLQLRRFRGSDLAARGWFRFSRNPGLVGMYVFYLGNCLVFPCAVLFAGFFPYVINMHNRVRMEESHLARTLGAPYRDYLARVPRYLFVGSNK